MKYYVLGLCVCLFSILPSSQARTIDYMQLHVDSADAVVTGTAQLGLVIEYSNGNTRRTRGLLKGLFKWSKVHISTYPAMQVDNGVLLLDQNKIEENRGVVQFRIAVLRGRDSFISYFHHQFPVLQNIEIEEQHIVGYVPNDMEVLACFSNGRAYTISNQKKIRALKMSDLDVEFPDYVQHIGSQVVYRPTWETYVKEVPICITSKFLDAREFRIPTSVNSKITCKLKGSNGENGGNGENGVDAPDAGYDPTDGTDGWNGGHGQKPENMYVFQKRVDDVYLTWLIYDGQQQAYVLGEEAVIEIFTVGGNGGNGGRGGRGGNGADATEEYDETYGGTGGNGGRGGDAGDGGDVYIISPGKEYKKEMFAIRNEAGIPGEGGKRGKAGYTGSEYEDEPSLISMLVRATIRPLGGGKRGSGGDTGKPGKIVQDKMTKEEDKLLNQAFKVTSDW